MWNAVEKGRLWLNIISLEEVSPEFGKLVEGMYAHLGDRAPHWQPHRQLHHPPHLYLLALRCITTWTNRPTCCGICADKKRLWVYPAMDLDLVPQDFLEEIYTGEISEFLPYEPDFNQRAESFLLTPGSVVSWPHNAPHRIQNLDMNVSLTTSFRAPTSTGVSTASEPIHFAQSRH